MSGWVAGAIVVGAVVGAGASAYSSQKASTAAKKAAAVKAAAQKKELEYLKDIDELPQHYKVEALKKLGGAFGLEGRTGTGGDQAAGQQELIDQAKASPLYSGLMSGREAGEEALLRTASATGGLRSGNIQEGLYDYNAQLQNQALLQSYNQQLSGLQSMAGLQTNEQQIGGLMSGVGQTQASGMVAQAQAQQQGIQGIGSAIGSGVGQYAQYKANQPAQVTQPVVQPTIQPTQGVLI